MAMPKTAVIAADGSFLKVVRSAEEKKEFEGQEVSFKTRKEYEAENEGKSFDEFIGEAKPVKPAPEPKAGRNAATALEGPYYILKPFPPTADDHPKKPIWNAIEAHDGGTCEEAKAACPAENPKRKTSGVYTFASEFRYFLKAKYVALGQKPEGFDYRAAAAAAEEAKPKKEKKAKAAKNETSEGTTA